MARCPKCSYLLVLLSRRNKYKCSKCRNLFPQKFIEDREFKAYNKRQRELDKVNLQLEIKQKWQEDLQKKLQKLKPKKKKLKLTKQQQDRKAYYRNYYYKHREKCILQKKLWTQKNKEYRKRWMKQYRLKQIDKFRQQYRIQFWRKKQKTLALQRLKNKGNKAYKPRILTSVSTYSLAQLLRLKKVF